ncbi:L,D-transpeptidase [Tianweitania sp. BSSL-BM11]|uniref:L,D-transpeptidase n=1 Tax=Tianweitania aestuarii TaxID=2814886 RepID=A0ABS5RTQ8_9HYPH|nr:L,D-transpeptidase [Tianweitania aestuarii]MBS9720430.1 L,D-transpeptidase [Tianweitania aestuarii]
MLLRNLVVAGLCSAVVFVSPAYAGGDRVFDFAGMYQRKLDAQTVTTGATTKPNAAPAKGAAAKTKSAADARKTASRSAQQGKTVTQAKQVTRTVAMPQMVQPVSTMPTVDVAVEGNNGELRSVQRPQGGFFKTIFGEDAPPRYLPETQTLDSKLAARAAAKPFKVKPEFEPQTVAFSGYDKGTVVIDTSARRLYLVESRDTARRYAIAVGKEGLAFKGTGTVGDKQEWPRWFPTKDMQAREPKKYGQYKDGMNGGPNNPLGARAIYLYQGKTDTHIRIHGTTQPESIGSASSNGCFRMINEHVMELYQRVPMGAQIVVL